METVNTVYVSQNILAPIKLMSFNTNRNRNNIVIKNEVTPVIDYFKHCCYYRSCTFIDLYRQNVTNETWSTLAPTLFKTFSFNCIT